MSEDHASLAGQIVRDPVAGRLGMKASSRSNCSCNASMCSWANSRGVIPFRTHSAAPVPAACPIRAQVAMTRVEDSAMCVWLMLRPANSRLEMFLE